MRVLMITPEATPYARTGGLGEVLSALPAALARIGIQVDVLMPKYREITPDRYGIDPMNLPITVTLNDKPVSGGFWKRDHPSGARYMFLEHDAYYDREGLYSDRNKDYEDNAERFVFLCRAAIEMALASGTHYDVYHCHDWQTALTPVYLRSFYAGEPLLGDAATVMTIHNLGYQGRFWYLDMPLVGVGWELFTPAYLEFYGDINMLKGGIVFADQVNTVSPGYRDEILTPEFGRGLEGVLAVKGDNLSGIVNGVDYEVWNPATDPRIAAPFDADDLSGKAKCKAELQRIAGFPLRDDLPLIGMVSRLDVQKGIDLVEWALPSFLDESSQFVVLGTGEARYQDSLGHVLERFPEKGRAFFTYDDELAHKILAGSDMLLVPSRYEPCGLAQLYAMRYGTIPVVRATGGLRDTVDECVPDEDRGTGFKFEEADPVVLDETVRRAIFLFRNDLAAWKRLMIRAMRADFSWNRSAVEYVKLYEKAIESRKQALRW
ncbi:MAG: glycogen synthase GlgA [Thermodesulfobacteriota bacterium]